MKMLGSAWTTASRHTTLRYTPLYFQNAVSLVDHFLLVGCPPYHGEEVWVHTPVTLRAIPVVAWLLAGPPMLERSKGRRQMKRDPPPPRSHKNHCLEVKRDLQRQGRQPQHKTACLKV